MTQPKVVLGTIRPTARGLGKLVDQRIVEHNRSKDKIQKIDAYSFPLAGTLALGGAAGASGTGGAGGGGSSQAPSDATYITQTASSDLSAEQALASLSTGIMKVTTTTGVVSSLAIPLTADNGGTGIASYAVGDLIYASGATTLAKLADVATGNVLLSGGVTTAPAYGKVGLTTHVSGTLPIANGGTNATTAAGARASLLNSFTGNSLKFLRVNAGETDTEWATVSGSGITIGDAITSGTANRVLYENASNNLDEDAGFQFAEATNTLTIGEAGNGGEIALLGGTSGTATISTAAAAGTPSIVLPTVNRTGLTALPGSTLPLLISSAGAESTASLTVAQGGTGAVTLTGVLSGNGTGAITGYNSGTDNHPVRFDGTGAVQDVANWTYADTSGKMAYSGALATDYVLDITNTSANCISGASTAGTGTNTAIYGYVASVTAASSGVKGEATGATGVTYGVYGINNSATTLATGVYGKAGANNGTVVGVQGETISTGAGGAGVYGNASGATGTNHGVVGSVTSTNNAAYSLYANQHSYLGTYADLPETTAPVTPDSGKMRLYSDTLGRLFLVTDGAITGRVLQNRFESITSSGTPTINTDQVDTFVITAQAANITSMTTNLSGSPSNGDRLHIAITDDGTARPIKWGTGWEASTVALPTTTVISTRMDLQFIYNATTSKWRILSNV